MSTQIDRVFLAGGASQFALPVVLRTPLGQASISSVRVFTGAQPQSGSNFLVDDIAYSTTPQPDTEISSGPAPFMFSGNQPDSGFVCSLDGAPAVSCRSPYDVGAVADGTHLLTVAMRDRYGSLDQTPAAFSWTVGGAVQPTASPAPPVRDRDGDGVPDAARQLSRRRQPDAGRRRP